MARAPRRPFGERKERPAGERRLGLPLDPDSGLSSELESPVALIAYAAAAAAAAAYLSALVMRLGFFESAFYDSKIISGMSTGSSILSKRTISIS